MSQKHKKTAIKNKNHTLSTYAYKNHTQIKSYFNICIQITLQVSTLEIHRKTKYHNRHNAERKMRTHLSNFAPPSRPIWIVSRSTNHITQACNKHFPEIYDWLIWTFCMWSCNRKTSILKTIPNLRISQIQFIQKWLLWQQEI